MVHRLEKLGKIRFLSGKIVAICFVFISTSQQLYVLSHCRIDCFLNVDICAHICTYDIVCFEKGKLGCISTLGLFIAEIAEVNYTVM